MKFLFETPMLTDSLKERMDMDTEAQIIHEDTKQQKDDNQDLDMSPFFF